MVNFLVLAADRGNLRGVGVERELLPREFRRQGILTAVEEKH